VGISTDGGHHWIYHTVPFLAENLYPESRRVAWAQTLSGASLRTDDGGRSWHTVWPANTNLRLPRGTAHRRPTLSVRSSTAATEVVPVTHTDTRTHQTLTNLVVYRTADGGAHWHRSAVGLPPG
jgi:photosystem II stability/assembly factor-like uncharacterized protein